MSGIARFGRLLAATSRDSLQLFRLAPLIPLVAVLTEFAQHVAEVRIGLFVDSDSFNRLSRDATRLAWGDLKITGLMIATFLAARCWVNRRDRRPWWSMASIAWRPLLVGFVLMTLASVPLTPGFGLPPGLVLVLSLAVIVLTLPLMVLAMAGLLGDREMSLARVYRGGWGRGLRIIALTAVGFVPLQLLHLGNHVLAIGQGEAVVWAIMVWDSLVVGLIAMFMGTAMHHGYLGGEQPAGGDFTGA
ncbi:hypothetical protein B2G71_15650 [Novosphingobium sp. PC22D]|uniref:hypothetical protein n=1 Tax=Novosphingobium sp. PC22D TaxID=1962403 RepID=UPI000BF0A3E4|nr:hypothetical protein [Novosphingobium sp. PC22D]PEQ11564.1 hypothetical protein B2G71_15650 [Novosphingobium sp. PC22D]